MITIHPRMLRGNWVEGFALDIHTLRSDYKGDDEYGHPQFDSIRSEMGELLYKLKYHRDESVLSGIVTTASLFIRSKKWPIDLIVSVPASRKRPKLQPVSLIVEEIARELSLEVSTKCISRVKESPELKNVFDLSERLAILKDAYKIHSGLVENRVILLFDDLYRSGATLDTIARLLKDEGKVKDLYALTLTMTRRNR